MKSRSQDSTVVARRRPPGERGAPNGAETALLKLHRELQQLSRRIPKREWKKFPPDFLDNLDAYLSGTVER